VKSSTRKTGLTNPKRRRTPEISDTGIVRLRKGTGGSMPFIAVRDLFNFEPPEIDLGDIEEDDMPICCPVCKTICYLSNDGEFYLCNNCGFRLVSRYGKYIEAAKRKSDCCSAILQFDGIIGSFAYFSCPKCGKVHTFTSG
jgi:hypothetical protein